MSKTDPRHHDDDFGEQVRLKQARKLADRRRRGKSLWFWLGMMGVVGWSVALPAVLGTLLGVWLDRTWPGELSWTLMGLAAGIAAGCLIAWGWVKRNSGMPKHKRKDRT